MSECGRFKVEIVLDAIRAEGGRIEKKKLLEKLSHEEFPMQKIQSKNSYLAEIELILQDLIFSKTVNIGFDCDDQSLWVPPSANIEIFLVEND